MKSLFQTKTNKQQREKKVLLGLVEEYIKTGLPVGSNTLKSSAFAHLSSATIRNYFSALEEQGFLHQLHTSGGRIPAQKAYRFYADSCSDSASATQEQQDALEPYRTFETKEIAQILQQSAETLSTLSQCAVFVTAPRFDHDFVIDLKLVPVDYHRFLCVIITDFGVIRTELLHADERLSAFSLKRIEAYFHYRLSGLDKPDSLSPAEEALAQKFYNETMVRYIVGYSNFIEEDVYKTGFSTLLHYPDFQDPVVLASSLGLFENTHSMRLLLRDCVSHNALKYWIGEDLRAFGKEQAHCSVLSIPYRINQQAAGAVGLLGPIRMPYRELFPLLRTFSDVISEGLTRNLYKFKISFRSPEEGKPYIQTEERHWIGQSQFMLLEDKSREVR